MAFDRPHASITFESSGVNVKRQLRWPMGTFPRSCKVSEEYTCRVFAIAAATKMRLPDGLLRHTNVEMMKRYVHPAEEHKRDATAKIEKFKTASAIELAANHTVTTKVTTAGRIQ